LIAKRPHPHKNKDSRTAFFSLAMKAIRSILYILFVLASALSLFSQSSSGRLRGRVLDVAGAVISGAIVKIADNKGLERSATTDRSGEFSIDLPSGKYILTVESAGFQRNVSTVELLAGRIAPVEITLDVALRAEVVTVDKEPPVNTNPEGNAGAVILQMDELRGLPDDPAELQAALQALAGPGAGPNGGEIFIDGFSGGKLPRKETIREVRINQNPFSSEFDRPGFGRIEIFTKPGTEDWSGELNGEFEDESLNSRSPFSANRPPYQLRNVNGAISGPIIEKKLSFYTDLEREGVDNNALINALVLDPNLVVTPFQRSFVVPTSNWDFGQRFDAQIGSNHTLVARFSIETQTSSNSGIGGFDLLSRAFNSTSREFFCGSPRRR
jgi:hypothetical protein